MNFLVHLNLLVWVINLEFIKDSYLDIILLLNNIYLLAESNFQSFA